MKQHCTYVCTGHQDSQAGLEVPAALPSLSGSADSLEFLMQVLSAAWAAWAIACQDGQCGERWFVLL